MNGDMDPITKDKIVTYAVVGLVALDMVLMGVIVGLNAAEMMTMETMLIVSTVLSVLMFAIIAAYILYSYKAKPKIMAYKEMRDVEKKGSHLEENTESSNKGSPKE